MPCGAVKRKPDKAYSVLTRVLTNCGNCEIKVFPFPRKSSRFTRKQGYFPNKIARDSTGLTPYGAFQVLVSTPDVRVQLPPRAPANHRVFIQIHGDFLVYPANIAEKYTLSGTTEKVFPYVFP